MINLNRGCLTRRRTAEVCSLENDDSDKRSQREMYANARLRKWKNSFNLVWNRRCKVRKTYGIDHVCAFHPPYLPTSLCPDLSPQSGKQRPRALPCATNADKRLVSKHCKSAPEFEPRPNRNRKHAAIANEFLSTPYWVPAGNWPP